MHYEIPCLHESGEAALDETVADFYPLTKQQIADLLTAAQTGDAQTRNSVQCRLVQGIRGMTCPQPIDDPLAKRIDQVDSLFVELWPKGADPGLVAEFYGLLNS